MQKESLDSDIARVPDGCRDLPAVAVESPTEKMRALLRSGDCRGSDDLDDYQADFRIFRSLEGMETADMRHQRLRRQQGTENQPAPDASGAAKADPSPEMMPENESGYVPSATKPQEHLPVLDKRLCVYSYAGHRGCRRCEDSCTAGAIRSGGEFPQFDTEACSGCGSCVGVCPSGALQWPKMPSADLLARLKRRLEGTDRTRPPVMVFTDRADLLPEAVKGQDGVVTMEVMPLGVLGMEMVLAALAWGAGAVRILAGSGAPMNADHPVSRTVQQCRMLVHRLGWPAEAVGRPEVSGIGPMTASLPAAKPIPPAEIDPAESKPVWIRMAAGHLAEHGGNTRAVIPLEHTASMGAVTVDSAACTLCMACVGACRVKALLPLGGVDADGLRFAEAQCVQCGLCRKVCPENAIDMTPRLNLKESVAAAPVVLHRTETARCSRCGQPFAARPLIDKIRRKLQDHWMYAGPEGQKRLGMCEQCRVQDIFS